MNLISRLSFLFGLSFLGVFAFAQSPGNVSFNADLIEISSQGESSKATPSEARSEIVSFITEQITLNAVKDLIGETKFQMQLERIKKKILPQASRYILSSKDSGLIQIQGKFQLALTLKVSPNNLKDLLLAEGLLYEFQGAPRVLPAFSLFDATTQQRFFLWTRSALTPEQNFLKLQAQKFNEAFVEQFKKGGFVYVDPFNTKVATQLVSQIGAEDELRMAEQFRAALVIRGEIAISAKGNAFDISLKWSAAQGSNGRIVSEVSRNFLTSPGPLRLAVGRKLDEIKDLVVQDLVAQVVEDWKRGTFGASRIELAVTGVQDYQEFMELKSALQQQIKELRAIRDRQFTPQGVVLELETTMGSQDLSLRMGALQLKSKKVGVQRWSTSRIEISLDPGRG